MRREVQLALRGATTALVMLGYLALLCTNAYASTVLLLPLAALLLMPVGELLDRRYPVYRQLTSGVNLAYAISLPVLLIVLDLMAAVTSLVMYVQLYSLVHEKKERNYDYIVLMSFFLLLAAAVQSPTPAIAIVLVLYIPAALWFFSALEMYASAERSGSPDSVELLDPRETGPPSAAVPQRLLDLRLVAWVGACSCALLVLTALFFYLTPRMEAGLLGASDPTRFVTGLAPEVDLALGGIIEQDTSTVMNVVFPDEEGRQYNGELLWRSTSLDHYTGSGWLRRGLTINLPGPVPRQAYRRYANSTVWSGGKAVDRQGFQRGRPVLQEIFMDEPPEGGIPSLPLVKTVIPAEGQKRLMLRWDRSGDFTIVLGRREVRGLQYRAWSEVFRPTPRALRNSSEDYDALLTRRDHRLLTRQNLLPETLELVRRVTDNAETVYDRVVAVERWLSSKDFAYSLTVPQLPEDHPIDAFLNETRTGHCDLYASAMALMLRSLDIPTRVVRGYRGGDWNEGDRSYTVTANMAHLWVEVFFPDHGWITFDPSPPLSDNDWFTLGALQRQVSFVTMKLRMLWYRRVVGFDPARGFQALRDVSLQIFRAPGAPDDTEEKEGVFAPLRRVAVPALASAAVLSLSFAALRALRRRRAAPHALTEDQVRAIRLHGLLTRRLRRMGIDHEGRTAEELREAIAGGRGTGMDAALFVLSAYNAVRFGKRSLSAEVFATLRRMVRSLPVPQP